MRALCGAVEIPVSVTLFRVKNVRRDIMWILQRNTVVKLQLFCMIILKA